MSFNETESIKKFYCESEVFITGASGYLGKVLIEKLLRSCPRINKIYILLREKKGKTKAERLQELGSSMLFDTLKDQNPEALEKLHPINGDVQKINLGLSQNDYEILKNCSVIFHCAATIRFDDPLKAAILTNTRGTREVCKLALTMSNLKSLVHVSTAYIQPRNLYVQEKLYPCSSSWNDYIAYAENFDEEFLNAMAPKLTEFAPNTYTYTKHLAEQVCIDYKEKYDLPIVIFRPSIVNVSEIEPITGWCDTFNGPLGLIMVGALGINHVTTCKQSNVLNVVPVDICIKGMIISAWKMWKDQQETREKLPIPVYNAASIMLVSFESLTDGLDRMISEHPSANMLGIPNVTFTPNEFYSIVIRFFRNLIPAVIIDSLLTITGNKPRMMKLQRIIRSSDKSLKYFYRRNFKFDNFKFIDLNLAIPQHEKEEFFLDCRKISGSDLFFKSYKIALKIHFGETERDTIIARQRVPYIYFFTRIIHAIFIYSVLKIAYIIFRSLV